MEKSQVYYQQGGGDEQYTPKYGVNMFKDQIILQEMSIK